MPPMKRTLSQASPPPEGGFGTPKHRSKKSKKAREAAAAASSTGTPLASSPPYMGSMGMMDSPRARSRSRSRSRSVSVALGGGRSKGKERAVEEPQPADAEGDAEEEEQEDEEELLFSDDEFGMNQKESARQKEDLRVLLEHFDTMQMDRYETYRRSGLTKSSVRRLVNSVLQQSVSAPILTVVRGFAKVFVGEVVEKARSVAKHDGPLTPDDLRQGYRLYVAEHEQVISAPGKKKLFVR